MWHANSKQNLPQEIPLLDKCSSAAQSISLNLRDHETWQPISPTDPNILDDNINLASDDGEETEILPTAIRPLIQIWLVVEKIIDIILVFLFTGIAVNWLPLFDLVLFNFWPLISSIPVLTIIIFLLRRSAFFKRWPECLLLKLLYLLHRTIVFVLFVHLQRFLYWFVCMIVAGTEATTFMLFVIGMGKWGAPGRGFWEYRVAMPIVVMVTSQPVYFYGGIAQYMEYGTFMMNIGTVVGISLLLSYQPVLVYQIYANKHRPPPPQDIVTKPVSLAESVASLTLQFNESMGRWEIVNF